MHTPLHKDIGHAADKSHVGLAIEGLGASGLGRHREACADGDGVLW